MSETFEEKNSLAGSVLAICDLLFFLQLLAGWNSSGTVIGRDFLPGLD